ncbi:hypothetical protein [uncultured Microscilla sp.]|uniref:hypothetical protein n=1 Tax=uncultured Microscilla sp. TaxID=432653 RepID=UPI00261F61AD|nr:hypothetical protein [uncultured Microscilla sp.]
MMKFKLTTIILWVIAYSGIQAQTITTHNVSGFPFCAGQTISVHFSITGVFNSGNAFSIQLSDASGDFSSPVTIGSLVGTSANSTFATLPTSTSAGTGYKVRVVSNDPVIIGSASGAFGVQTASGDPTLFGDGFWYGHTYLDNNWNTYVGYFQTGADLGINTVDYYPIHQSPDNYGSFVACGDVPDNNHSVSFKRTNFVCGKYQMNVTGYDDKLEIYVNGVQVLSTTTCCQNLGKVWEGYLGPNSEVEVRYAEYYGNGYLNFELVKNGDFQNTFTLSPNPAVCVGVSANLSIASEAITGMDYTWAPATDLNTTTGKNVTATPSTTTTYTVTATDPTTGCSESKDITVTVSNTPTISITATNATICAGESTSLTATGANTYSWSPATGLNNTAGNTVIASPATTTTYTVTGDNGCGITTTQTFTVNVGSPITDASVFGNGTWNVYCYSGDFTSLEGMYTEPNLSFKSSDRWGLYDTPSNASGYNGCTIWVNNHAVSYKRTNFDCGFYQLDVPLHDDQYWLYINGVEVATHDGWGDGHTNVWTGMLGPSSTVEFRWKEGGGASAGELTFTKLDLVQMPAPSVCANVPVALAATYDPDATYSWSPATGLSSTTSASVTATVSSPTTYTVTATKDGCTLTDQITVQMSTLVGVTVTPSTPVICGGQSVTLTANGASSYTWSPATGLSATTGGVVTASPTSTTTYTVTGYDGCTTGSTTVTVTVGGTQNPNVFGDGQWNVYCYNGNDFQNYYGMYVEPDLSFDSRNRWNLNTNPSLASGYTGCTLPDDQYSISYKRTNFTCGYYQIDITNHDDYASLWIDGVEVFNHEGCCDSHTDVWKGFLGSTSTVELRCREFNGNSHGGLAFTNLSSTLNITSPDVTICETTSSTLTASLSGTNITWSTDATYIDLSTTTGNTVIATAKAGANGARTITCTATDPITGCQLTRTINITVDPLTTTQVTASMLTICKGETVTLTASGANTYSWATDATLSATTGSSVTATPATTTTYTVTGSNNCSTKDAQVTIVVKAPTLTGTEYGDGQWNVFCYEGKEFDKLNGHYEETSLSFDTRSKWNAYTTPSNAPGYIGCEVPADNHSYVYKRTNFPCGSYRIDIPNHDDYCELRIDGVTVFSHDDCCDSHVGVWTGLLLPTSKVEFLIKEGVGGSHGGLNIGFSVASATTVIWTGEFNNDWFNSLNWCENVPNATTNVIIPGAGVANWPVINGNGALCKNLTIESGANFTISGTHTLDVHGSWMNNGGVLSLNNSTVRFMSTHDEMIGGTSSSVFYNLQLEAINQTITLGASIEVNNILTLNSVELGLNQNKLSINNALPTALVRIGSGFINSEAVVGTNQSIVSWYTGTNVASYVFPFGVSAAEYIPVTFNKKTNTNTTISISTRGTGVNNLPLVPGVNLTGISGADATLVVDRWWDISSSVNPLPAPGADITLSYRGSENTLPTPAVQLAIQHYNATIGDWDSPYLNYSTGTATGIGTVTAVNITDFSPHVISMATMPLPVSFLNFKVTPNMGQAYLDWVLQGGHQAKYFSIERSQDGVRYYALAKVNAQDLANTYQWIDKQPHEGISYYRIAQFNKDNTYGYSPVKSFNTKLADKVGMLVVPNPASGKNIQLQLKGVQHKEICQAIIYSVQGAIVHQQEVAIKPQGTQIVRLLPSTPLAEGLYHIEMKMGKKALRANFVVSN